MRETLVQVTYLAAAILFILGLRSLTRPDTALRGMRQAALGMLLAIIGTLVSHEILTYGWIAGGLVLGAIIGYPMGVKVPMTAMPQRIAIALTFGATAATLVGISEYARRGYGAELSRATMAALGFEVLLGAVAIGGSLIAAGKLQEILPGKPITFKGQNAVNFLLFAALVAMLGWLVYAPANAPAFYALIALAVVLGLSFVLPIGGADMPVVVALLNSYAGLAASATGFAIGNTILIVCGALDGVSGFILALLMSKAMNRSFTNVLFGAFGAPVAASGKGITGSQKPISVEDAAGQLAYASRVVVIPGYGMAVAQSQHQVRELTDLIEKRGGEVKFAIHPVAGRMPGHLNVILAEANVAYDKLITDVDDANQSLGIADVAVVIGANDIVNPAAEDEPGSPIYGMPVIRAWTARTVFVVKRGQGVGFAGIENPLFYRDNTRMLYGDAKGVATALTQEIKGMDSEGHF
jgi:H+-translocating NAD(P) transhydrogenase subunit beta